MKRKSKIAIVSLTSCEGCQIVLLDLGERFFDFLKKVYLMDFKLIEEQPFPKGKIDVVFVEGNPITKENLKLLKEVRKKAKILVAMGNCAALGGIPEMKNYKNKEKTIRYIYKGLNNISNPEIKGIGEFVKVDFVIPGCPINGEEYLECVKKLAQGKIPEICQSPVCTECPKCGKEECFLAQKKICFGSISLAGCRAICPKNEFPCLACRGLLEAVQPKNFLKTLEKFETAEEIRESLEIFGIRDEIEKVKK